MGWKCPSSPVLRQRRNGAVSLPTFSIPYRSRSRVEFVHAKGDLTNFTLIEENERGPRACSPQTLYEQDELENLDIQDLDTQRWNIAHSLCERQESQDVYSSRLSVLFEQHLRYLVRAIRFYATHLMISPSLGSHIFPDHPLQSLR